MTSHTSPETPLSAEQYYKQFCGSSSAFRDFDDRNVFKQLNERARSAQSRNFILDFSTEHAWCAFDQEVDVFDSLLADRRPSSLDTRWINIWGPDQQTDVVLALARKFEFSPRLAGLMCSPPRYRHYKLNKNSTDHARSWSLRSKRSLKSIKTTKSAPAAATYMVKDVEQDAPARIEPTSLTPEVDLLHNLNHYDVVDSLWHWSSVDLGRHYVCLGYNSLYNIDPSQRLDPSSHIQDLPNGTRVWSWLILCDDKTVITIFESTLPDSPTDSTFSAASTRYNLLNVFAQLSNATDPSSRNPISLVPLRYAVSNNLAQVTPEPVDGPGLLFYYLFDDWHTTYSLVAKRGHQYSAELNRLRESMMTRANLAHVTRLHHIGRQLAVLKRLYESYDLIITRVLGKQREPPSTTEAGQHSCPSFLGVQDKTSPGPDQLGVFLTSAARVRFERLGDRIKLYALSEIQESIDLKDSLVSMNFNLITIRESDAVERLTRITILLAKVTILFLPVSLMTAYFSTQLKDAGDEFTVRSYWISFAVIMVLSFVGLYGFGKLSGTVEGQMVYKPLNQVMYEIFTKVFGRQSARDGNGEKEE